MVITGMPFSSYILTLKKFRKLWSFILISFSFPILFSFGSNVNAIFNLGPLKITEQGFMTGSIFALRIISMLWVTFLLSEFTSPVNMAEGIRKVLSPFGFFGLPVRRLSSIISISWQSLPLVWEKTRWAIRNEKTIYEFNNKRAGLVRRTVNLIEALSNIVTFLYQQGGEQQNNTGLIKTVLVQAEKQV
jgi:energy-coupling factor transport system permease protein